MPWGLNCWGHSGTPIWWPWTGLGDTGQNDGGSIRAWGRCCMERDETSGSITLLKGRSGARGTRWFPWGFCSASPPQHAVAARPAGRSFVCHLRVPRVCGLRGSTESHEPSRGARVPELSLPVFPLCARSASRHASNAWQSSARPGPQHNCRQAARH